MAFSYAVSSSTVMGDKRWKFGTWDNTADYDGGDITTGLSKIDACGCVNYYAAGSMVPKFTISGGTITIEPEKDATGIWWAVGL